MNVNEREQTGRFLTKGQNGEYEHELARFIHIHSPVHEQISEGLTL